MNNVKLQAAREKVGLTQSQVARKSNVTERMYQQYEYGAEPGVRTAIRVAKALNTTVEDLFDDAPISQEKDTMKDHE